MPYRSEDDRRRSANAYGRGRSSDVRDVAPGYPPPGDLARRAACQGDLLRFLTEYFPQAFSLPWCADHLAAIGRLQEVSLRGGLFAVAMPRGSGKTTLAVRAALWALLYGHRRFVCLVGATEDHAKDLLEQIKAELTLNEALAGDFRQACHCLRALEGNARRASGQLFDGRPTRPRWSADRLTFPTMPASALDGPDVSGSTVTVSGLTGALRGKTHALPGGRIVRPELVILDDPQTRESAGSPKQNADRAAIVKGDVLGMAGPGQKIAAVMPCTVIRENDLACEFLDRRKSPEWAGQRARMVDAFPEAAAEPLWERYRAIRAEALEAGRGVAECNAFYAEHRAAMDAGARVAWPERYEPDELSALQHAMNLRYRDERAFWAEYQNEPLPDADARPDDLTPDAICARVNRLPRGVAPAAATRLTAFVDVQGSLLYWALCAWEDDFTGSVVAYGAYPDQKRPYFTLKDARATLEKATKSPDLEGRLYAGLDALLAQLAGRDWPRDDGAGLKLERCLVDANWGLSTDVVKKFCRQSAHASVLTPSHGKFIGAASNPMAEWPRRVGERAGPNWRLRSMEGSRSVRSAIYDANFWKSFLHTRLSVPLGSRTALSLHGDRPEAHRMLADHLTAEYRVPVVGRGRSCDEWKPRPDRRDNHWLDALAGCCVAASMLGVALPAATAAPASARRKRVTFAELRDRRRAGPSAP